MIRQRISILTAIGIFMAVAALPLAAQPQRPQRDPDTPPAEDTQVQCSGQVVDAETGKPVEHFTLEGGGWWNGGGKQTDGRFSVFVDWHGGQPESVRVLAEGYLPEMVKPEPATTPGNLTGLVVKLKRGATIRGLVLDHAGKPVSGADLFLVGGQRFELSEGEPHGPRTKSNFVTVKDGRFAISGAGPKDQRLLIAAPPPGLNTWVVSVADPIKEITIRLPAPATLAIRYDIPGAPDQGEFRLELETWEMPQWENIPGIQRLPKAVNGRTTTLADLTPGKYDLARIKTLGPGAGDRHWCDRRTITVESGKVTEASFARPKGAPVHGTVEGLAQAKLSGATILVRPAEATGNDLTPDQEKLPVFDALTCGPDGTFTTEKLMPGTYSIVVEVPGPQSAGMGLQTAVRQPVCIGLAKVTVPETGQPPEVKVQIKLPSDGPATSPTTPASQPAVATITLRGIVLDHAGKPVVGAEIFVAGPERNIELIELRDDPDWPRAKSDDVTDKDGHFKISGIETKAQQLVISAPLPALYAWGVDVADPTKEVTIKLPEPAKLTIRYDIPGAPDESEFRVIFMAGAGALVPNLARVERQAKASNGQTTTVVGLTPGKYDVSRCKTVFVGGDLSWILPCDRRIITVEAGQQAEAAFARAKGAPVRGTVEGLAAAKMPRAVITVQAGEAIGYAAAAGGQSVPLYADVLACGPDGAFTTETLMPGTYTIGIAAYAPEPAEGRGDTAFRLPDYVGSAKVTVPETGQPPEVKVQIKPRSELTPPPRVPPATTAPGTSTAPAPALTRPLENK